MGKPWRKPPTFLITKPKQQFYMTPREQEMTYYLCEFADSVAQVAHDMGLATGTVRVYLARLYAKMVFYNLIPQSVNPRLHLMLWYWKKKVEGGEK